MAKVVQTSTGWYVVAFHWMGHEFDSKPMRNPGPANMLAEQINTFFRELTPLSETT